MIAGGWGLSVRPLSTAVPRAEAPPPRPPSHQCNWMCAWNNENDDMLNVLNKSHIIKFVVAVIWIMLIKRCCVWHIGVEWAWRVWWRAVNGIYNKDTNLHLYYRAEAPPPCPPSHQCPQGSSPRRSSRREGSFGWSFNARMRKVKPIRASQSLSESFPWTGYKVFHVQGKALRGNRVAHLEFECIKCAA